jgi:hypothetical protein
VRSVFAPPENRFTLARHEAQVLAAGISRIVQFRDNHPELKRQFIDVNCSDLEANPEIVVQRIYDNFRLPWTQVSSWRVRECARRHSTYPPPSASPAAANFFLDTCPETKLFNDYCDRFNIRRTT